MVFITTQLKKNGFILEFRLLLFFFFNLIAVKLHFQLSLFLTPSMDVITSID